MSFHTLAYYSSIQSTSLTQIAAVADIYPQDSNNFVLKSNMSIVGSMAVGGSLAQARINQPSLNMVSLPYIRGINVATTPDSPASFDSYSPVPLPCKGNEDLRVDAANSQSTTAAGVYALLWVSDGFVPVPQGPVYTIYGTASTVLALNVWSPISNIVWSSTLTQGKYSLVGLSGVSAGAIAVRATLLGQYQRGGVPAFTSIGNRHCEFIRSGGLGSFGTFESYALPTIEFLSSSADTSETIELSVVKIG